MGAPRCRPDQGSQRQPVWHHGLPSGNEFGGAPVHPPDTMFSFFPRSKMSRAPEVNPAPPKPPGPQPLDPLAGGAFPAAPSGERAARIRDWLLTEPAPEQLQEVFKELSRRDKGAARAVRERLDEIRRAKGQQAIAAEWAEKAQALLATPKLNIADAMAWQRDAAKAGAPLSREPLSLLKIQVAQRVQVIEDLQHRVQVQREAAVLLAQRIEVLSTKPWRDALAALDALRADVAHWQEQALQLSSDASWASVDLRFPPLLEASRSQLLVVWEAFQPALAQAAAAAEDAAAPLPPVPVWADELRAARGLLAEAAAKPARAARPKPDPEVLAQATELVRAALATLEKATAEGHGKASAGAAAALRAVLKAQGKHIDDKLEQQVHAALVAAGELEGWQRWSTDKVREDLVAKAEALLTRPEGQTLGGRKMQETLRHLRDQWKQADQGGAPNHALWKRFDEACNAAHKVVELWLDNVRSEAAEHKAQRLALIEELKDWAQQPAASGDWKAVHRALQQFGERWREGGHVGEKIFAELQPLWKQALALAAAPLEAAQKESLARRQAMIEEANALGAAATLRIDAVKALQQRWQAEAQTVPLERKHEQKLWEAFRKPLDEAFQRKSTERERAVSELSARDRMVLDAANALQAANASADAQQIRAAMQAVEAGLRGQGQAAQVLASAPKDAQDQVQVQVQVQVQEESAQDATKSVAHQTPEEGADPASAAGAPAAPPPPPPPPAAAPPPRGPPRQEEGHAARPGRGWASRRAPRRPAGRARPQSACRWPQGRAQRACWPRRRPPAARRARSAPGRHRFPRPARRDGAGPTGAEETGRVGPWRGADPVAHGLATARRSPGARHAGAWRAGRDAQRLDASAVSATPGRCVRSAAAPGDSGTNAHPRRAHRRAPDVATAIAHAPQRPGPRPDLGPGHGPGAGQCQRRRQHPPAATGVEGTAAQVAAGGRPGRTCGKAGFMAGSWNRASARSARCAPRIARGSPVLRRPRPGPALTRRLPGACAMRCRGAPADRWDSAFCRATPSRAMRTPSDTASGRAARAATAALPAGGAVWPRPDRTPGASVASPIRCRRLRAAIGAQRKAHRLPIPSCIGKRCNAAMRFDGQRRPTDDRCRDTRACKTSSAAQPQEKSSGQKLLIGSCVKQNRNGDATASTVSNPGNPGNRGGVAMAAKGMGGEKGGCGGVGGGAGARRPKAARRRCG